MGQGKGGNVNLDFILRIVELVILIAAIIFFMISGNKVDLLVTGHRFDSMRAFDAMCITASLFVIVLLILLGMQIIKGEEQDQKFVGSLSTIGAILLISTGIVVCIHARHYSDNVLISGIIAIVGGAALVIEALKDFGVF